MATTQEFVNAMETIVKIHSVYIGTANGQLLADIPIGDVFKMERNYGRRDSSGNPLWWSDTARDFEFIAKCYRAKFDMTQAKAGDCSGIIVGVLRALGVIKPTADYRVRDFQDLSTPVPLNSISPGDLVFDKEMPATGKSIAGHIGVYSGDGKVVDSRGRDVGVIERSFSDYKWRAAGRLDWFSDTIPPLRRNLKYIEGNLMRGEDVRECQEQLIKKGYDPGITDGIFGLKTKDAVIWFQTAASLEIDGIVGQKTWTKLFES